MAHMRISHTTSVVTHSGGQTLPYTTVMQWLPLLPHDTEIAGSIAGYGMLLSKMKTLFLNMTDWAGSAPRAIVCTPLL